jgi:hypothetical protein
LRSRTRSRSRSGSRLAHGLRSRRRHGGRDNQGHDESHEKRNGEGCESSQSAKCRPQDAEWRVRISQRAEVPRIGVEESRIRVAGRGQFRIQIPDTRMQKCGADSTTKTQRHKDGSDKRARTMKDVRCQVERQKAKRGHGRTAQCALSLRLDGEHGCQSPRYLSHLRAGQPAQEADEPGPQLVRSKANWSSRPLPVARQGSL